MSYQMFFCTPSDDIHALPEFRQSVAEVGNDATVAVAEGTADEPVALRIAHEDGTPIATITRLDVDPDDPDAAGSQLLAGLLDDVQEAVPPTAARWLQQYLPGVQCVYQIELLEGTEVNQGWDTVYSILDDVLRPDEGVLYAEAEGWSNEEGAHITWEFDDDVDGPWWMAVRQGDEWVHFRMDLGNKKHRQAFQAGRVPDGVKPT